MTGDRIAPTVAGGEGTAADWFARGFEAGVIEGAGQAVREVVVLEAHVRALTEKVVLLIRGMQERYSEVGTQRDRWQPHPMYERGVELFAHREAADQPTAQQCWAAEAPEEPVEQPKRGRRRKADPEPGPTLDLAMPMAAPPDPDADLTDEEQMRRAAGRAWRA